MTASLGPVLVARSRGGNGYGYGRQGGTGVAARHDAPYTSGVVLYRFHAILVACAVVFCLGFAAYEGFTYRQRAAAVSLWIAIFFMSMEERRSTWQSWHVRAEAQRHVRAAQLPTDRVEQLVD